MSLFRKLRPSKNSFVIKADTNTLPANDDRSKMVFNGAEQGATKQSDAKLYITPGLSEVILASCDVLYEVPYSSDTAAGDMGTLVVTNFKVSFLPFQSSCGGTLPSVNKLFGNDDIVLWNIQAVYKMSKSKRRRLLTGCSISRRVRRIEIHCKDFRIHWFNFKKSHQAEAMKTVNHILAHAFPITPTLRLNSPSMDTLSVNKVSDNMSTRYNTEADWVDVLQRLNAANFKVVHCNSRFQLSESMPECFVVPSSMSGSDVTNLSHKFYGNRCPVWSYTHSNKASIMRMDHQLPGLDEDAETQVFKHVQQSHPSGMAPATFDLSSELPSLVDLQSSYESLRKLCMPPSLKDLWQTDRLWYSMLENSRWLSIVGSCLLNVCKVASHITDKCCSVILKERDSCDFASLISCLVQLLLDDHCRTVNGFEELIDREWIALGHRFIDRYSARSAEQCPVFLLFLDCVGQMRSLCPGAFQFSDIYLVRVWDSLCIGAFRTFRFNSLHDRSLASKKAAELLPSAWDWSLQFQDTQMSLMYDGIYDFGRESLLDKHNDSRQRFPVNGNVATATCESQQVPHSSNPNCCTSALRLHVRPAHLKLWSLCYLRWLSPVMVIGGGPACEYLTQCLLAEEIGRLQKLVSDLETISEAAGRPRSMLIFGCSFGDCTNGDELDSSFNQSSAPLSSSFPFVPRISGAATPSRLSQIPSVDTYFEGSFLSTDLECTLDMEEDVDSDSG